MRNGSSFRRRGKVPVVIPDSDAVAFVLYVERHQLQVSLGNHRRRGALQGRLLGDGSFLSRLTRSCPDVGRRGDVPDVSGDRFGLSVLRANVVRRTKQRLLRVQGNVLHREQHVHGVPRQLSAVQRIALSGVRNAVCPCGQWACGGGARQADKRAPSSPLRRRVGSDSDGVL